MNESKYFEITNKKLIRKWKSVNLCEHAAEFAENLWDVHKTNILVAYDDDQIWIDSAVNQSHKNLAQVTLISKHRQLCLVISYMHHANSRVNALLGLPLLHIHLNRLHKATIDSLLAVVTNKIMFSKREDWL